MKARLTFDTLAYANRLKAAGLESKIAETQAQVNAEMLASLLESVVMRKEDLSEFATKKDLASLATKEDLARLEAQMHTRLEHQEAQMNARFEHLGTQLTLRLGGIMVSAVIGLTAFLSYFHLIH